MGFFFDFQFSITCERVTWLTWASAWSKSDIALNRHHRLHSIQILRTHQVSLGWVTKTDWCPIISRLSSFTVESRFFGFTRTLCLIAFEHVNCFRTTSFWTLKNLNSKRIKSFDSKLILVLFRLSVKFRSLMFAFRMDRFQSCKAAKKSETGKIVLVKLLIWKFQSLTLSFAFESGRRSIRAPLNGFPENGWFYLKLASSIGASSIQESQLAVRLFWDTQTTSSQCSKV